MKLTSLARRNIVNNLHKYILYFITNISIVAVYFLVDNFSRIDVAEVGMGVPRGSSLFGMVYMIKFAVVTFFIFFNVYSKKVFLRDRYREFGLLKLYGFSRKYLKKYIFLEAALGNFGSIGFGLIFGGFFSRLFIMVMSGVIGVKFAYKIWPLSLLRTLGIFLVLFVTIDLWSIYRLNEESIIDSIKMKKEFVKEDRYIKIKAFLGIICLLLAYTLAIFPDRNKFYETMILVNVLILLGIYFAFSYLSIYFINFIKNKKSYFYKRDNFLLYNSLSNKVRDISKMLFISCLINTVGLVVLGLSFAFPERWIKSAGANTYNDMCILVYDERAEEDRIKFEEYLGDKKVAIKDRYEYEGLSYNIGDDFLFLISNSDYNRALSSVNEGNIELPEGHVVFSDSFGMKSEGQGIDEILEDDIYPLEYKEREINLGGKMYVLDKQYTGSPIGISHIGYKGLFVLNDQDYKLVERGFKHVRYIGINVENPRDIWNIDDSNREIISENLLFYNKVDMLRRMNNYKDAIKFFNIFTTIFLFTSSNSLLYFKNYGRIRREKQEYSTLRDLGVSKEDIEVGISKGLKIVFFSVGLVSVVNFYFSMRVWKVLTFDLSFRNISIIISIYALVQIVEFILLKKNYISKLDI